MILSNHDILTTVNDLMPKKDHLTFMDTVWMGTDKFQKGIHTIAIADEINRAFYDYNKGISTYLAIKCVFRHGKSDLTSRYLPPHFLGEFPNDEVVVCAYNSSLAAEFSKDARNIIRSEKYQQLYPKVKLAQDSSAVDSWRLEGYNGRTLWAGILGGITGKGGNLIVIDDFFENREAAESQTIRDKIWYEFTNSIMSRRGRTCIVIITATPWSVDDLFGRIEKRMQEDQNFPRFKEIKWPAYSDKYPKGYLFPERYDRAWYDSNKATLGNYAFSALMQCEPIPRGGNMLRTDKIKWLSADEWPKDLHYARGWDLASSKKELTKSDPDYTVGVKLAVRLIPSAIPGVRIPIIFISDVIRGRWEAGRRNEIIRDCAIGEPGVRVGCEAFGGYKDAFTIIRDTLSGIRHVEDIQLPGDKRAKAEVLVAPLEAGNVYCLDNSVWKDEFLSELSTFPDGQHDDIVDGCTVAMATAIGNETTLIQYRPDIIDKGDFELSKENVGWEYYHGLFVEAESTIVVTAMWNSHSHRLYVMRQKRFNTIQEIVQYCRGKAKTVANSDIMSNDYHSLYRELIKERIIAKPLENFDALASVYRLNTLIQDNCFIVNQLCTDLIVALQNDTDIKHLSPCLQALLYIVSDNIERFRPEPPKEHKAFSRERYEAHETMKYGSKPKELTKTGWVN